ncbi:MAG: MBL fold metallo-hydrolase [Verrucomicrobiales bacterium]|nr:MBL fold metallo-hydrolase [Verrucomicrobiales bacterium]
MNFHSFARGIDVGAHSYLVEIGGSRIVLDAGTHPKHDGLDTLPILDRLHYDSADAIVVTHAHLDHIGALPVLCERLPGAPVLATEETLVYGEAMLHNSVNVMTAQRRELDIIEYPLYTHRDLDNLRPRWQALPFHRTFPIDEAGRVTVRFLPAGHVSGAAAVLIQHEERTIFYTGDLHFEDQSLCRRADFSEIEGRRIDAMIVETTRGDSPRRPDYTRESETERFLASILETLGRGGSVMVPVFAFGKTQELLVLLHQAIEEGRLPRVPVYLGGLGTKITHLFDKYADRSRRLMPGFQMLRDFPGLKRPAKKDPEPEYAPGCIYALSSGMMSENTVSNRFARHFLPNPKNAILFIGYADPDTPGGRILATNRGGEVSLNDRDGGRVMRIDCQIEKFDFSGHAPREQLLDFIIRQNPRHTLLVHGDEPARLWFAGELRRLAPQMQVTIPEPGMPIDL